MKGKQTERGEVREDNRLKERERRGIKQVTTDRYLLSQAFTRVTGGIYFLDMYTR